MDNEKEIVWTDDMGFMPPMVKTEGRIICRHECQLTEYKAEIERLREAAKDRPKDRPNDAVNEIERLRELFELERKDNIDVRYHLAKANDQIERVHREMAMMVKREHYINAIKSLSVCQNQIETMMLELRRLDPKNAIAGDAYIVLGMLEAMITLNPDMQTDEWKADQKAKQEVRDAEYRAAKEKRRAKVQELMWEGTSMITNAELKEGE